MVFRPPCVILTPGSGPGLSFRCAEEDRPGDPLSSFSRRTFPAAGAVRATILFRTGVTHMICRRAAIAALSLSLVFSVTAPAQPDAAREKRMQWWREARFGMFIHWGLYAVPAGEWKGQPIPGIGEWIMNRAQDPGGGVRAARRRSSTRSSSTPTSGCRWPSGPGRSTSSSPSKHHDGFAMFELQGVSVQHRRCDALRPRRHEGAGRRPARSRASSWASTTRRRRTGTTPTALGNYLGLRRRARRTSPGTSRARSSRRCASC